MSSIEELLESEELEIESARRDYDDEVEYAYNSSTSRADLSYMLSVAMDDFEERVEKIKLKYEELKKEEV